MDNNNYWLCAHTKNTFILERNSALLLWDLSGALLIIIRWDRVNIPLRYLLSLLPPPLHEVLDRVGGSRPPCNSHIARNMVTTHSPHLAQCPPEAGQLNTPHPHILSSIFS
jgi:hypothetical protein